MGPESARIPEVELSNDEKINIFHDCRSLLCQATWLLTAEWLDKVG